jgi:hypothetical protein
VYVFRSEVHLEMKTFSNVCAFLIRSTGWRRIGKNFEMPVKIYMIYFCTENSAFLLIHSFPENACMCFFFFKNFRFEKLSD